MAAKGSAPWRMDWAGSHGTAWGTVNGYLTTVTATWCGRWGMWHLDMPHSAVIAGTALAATGGVVYTLARAAFARDQPHPVTVAYKVLCWTGAGAWATLAQVEPAWTVSGAASYLACLAGGAVVAGGVAALVDGDLPDAGQMAGGGKDTSQQRSRDAEGRVWEDRIRRVCGRDVEITAIEVWGITAPDGRPVGRTIEGTVVSANGASWRAIQAGIEGLEVDAGLDLGCGIQVYRGRTKANFVLQVTEVNVLAQEQLYPEDYGHISVHDPIPVMTAADGQVAGPLLRLHCVGIFGEANSGKSNTAQVYGAGVARMRDALLCDFDPTGNRLSRDLLAAFVAGRVDRPAVWWAATDPHEGWLMLRALQRGAIFRNNSYGDLCRQANDDKVPISQHIPAFVVRSDEIAHSCGQTPDDPGVEQRTRSRAPQTVPSLPELQRSIVFDQRAPGVRGVYFGLRATNDVIQQGIQSQLHGVGVLRATGLAEYRWAFGSDPPCDPQDAPWPGCIQMRLDSAAPISPYHVWRLAPQQLEAIGEAVAGWQPNVDDGTLQAMNGRDVDGRPFDDLYPGELDCVDTRWQRYFEKYGITRTPPTMRADGTTEEVTVSEQPHLTLDQADANLRQAQENLRRRVAEIQAQREGDAGDGEGDDGEQDGDPVDPGAWASVLASWEAGENATWQDHATRVIASAGADGIGPGAILKALSVHGITVHRDTLNDWLRSELQARRVCKPRHGRWAAVVL